MSSRTRLGTHSRSVMLQASSEITILVVAINVYLFTAMFLFLIKLDQGTICGDG